MCFFKQNKKAINYQQKLLDLVDVYIQVNLYIVSYICKKIHIEKKSENL